MMSYEEYLNTVQEELQRQFPETEITIQQVDKLQGQSYLGISIRPDEKPTSIVLNVKPFYELVQEDESRLDSSLAAIVSMAEKELPSIPSIPIQDLSHYEKVREQLRMQMVPVEKNREILGKIPHQTIGDMAVVYRLQIGKSDDGRTSALITNENLMKYGVSAEELHQDAIQSQREANPPVLKNMGEVIGFLGAPNDSGLWIATTEDGFWGSSACQFPDFMQECSEKLGGSFYALPSSIHELIFLPDDGNVKREALESMVREINRTELREEDILSDQVYHYDGKEQIFELASDYESRKQAEQTREAIFRIRSKRSLQTKPCGFSWWNPESLPAR